MAPVAGEGDRRAVAREAEAFAMPEIVFVTEMASPGFELGPLPAELVLPSNANPAAAPAARLDPATQAAFDAAWARVRGAVDEAVTAEALAAISRWAVEATRSASKPAPSGPGVNGDGDGDHRVGALGDGTPTAASWIERLPMRPLGMAIPNDGPLPHDDGSTGQGAAARRFGAFPRTHLVFGCEPEESTWRLPTHHPLVTRAVVVEALFDPTRNSIPRVIVSIRGWAEE